LEGDEDRVQVQLALLGPRYSRKVSDQPVQSLRLLGERLQGALVDGQYAISHRLDRCLDGREGGAQLVRQIGQ